MYLLSQYKMVNYLIIKKNYTLQDPQKQYGEFKEFSLYPHSAEEVIRMQFSSYLPAKSSIMLILLFLCPRIAHLVVHIHTYGTGVV